VTLEAVAQCGTTIGRALAGGDWVGGAHAAITCLTANAEKISVTAAGILARQMPSVAPEVLGKAVGEIGGRLWEVWAAGMLFQAMTWASDAALVDAARTFTVFTTTATPAGTRVLAVRPVDAAGQLAPGYTVTQTLTAEAQSPVPGASGGCNTGSDVGGAQYRCFGVSGGVYDPCWAEGPAATAVSVLCLARPWATTTVRMRLSGPLEPLPPPDPVAPWGLQLSNGLRCVALQGSHGSFNGRAVDYYCGERTPPDMYVLSGIDRSRPLWRVQTATYPLAGSTYTMGPVVVVVVAWALEP
jgi:hypothetical protein